VALPMRDRIASVVAGGSRGAFAAFLFRGITFLELAPQVLFGLLGRHQS